MLFARPFQVPELPMDVKHEEFPSCNIAIGIAYQAPCQKECVLECRTTRQARPNEGLGQYLERIK